MQNLEDICYVRLNDTTLYYDAYTVFPSQQVKCAIL